MQPDILLAIDKAHKGDSAYRTYLVEANAGLVHSIVNRFLNRGHDPEDLFQVGCIGLIKAIDKFDASYKVQFSTYAVPLITGEIKRYIRDDGIIKVSRSIKELGIKARAAHSALCGELGREPTTAEIAKKTGASEEDVVIALDACSAPESLNAERDGALSVGECTAGEESAEDKSIDHIALKEALSSLAPRERQIILMRYFMEKTQSEIARLLNISQVQVSRIEKSVLEKMRKKLE